MPEYNYYLNADMAAKISAKLLKSMLKENEDILEILKDEEAAIKIGTNLGLCYLSILNTLIPPDDDCEDAEGNAADEADDEDDEDD